MEYLPNKNDLHYLYTWKRKMMLFHWEPGELILKYLQFII